MLDLSCPFQIGLNSVKIGDAPVGKQGAVKLSRQFYWQLAHRERGLCRLCSEPVEPGYKTHCYRHRVGTTRRPHWSDEKKSLFVAHWNDGTSEQDMSQQFQLTKAGLYAAVRRLRAAGHKIER